MDLCTSHVNYNEFDVICRFCLSRDLFLKPLFFDQINEKDDFASDEGNETVTEMIYYCTQIKISQDDHLPKFMCCNCLEQLSSCNKFRTQCLKSLEILESIASDHQENKKVCGYNSLNYYSASENSNEETNLHFDTFVETEEPNEIEKTPEDLFASGPFVVSEDEDNEPIIIVDSNLSEDPTRKDDTPSDDQKTDEDEKSTNNRHRQCQICGAMTQGLRLHMLTHTGEKGHKCQYCGKSFSQKGNLIRHVNIHTNNRKYKCHLCDKTFTDPSSLKSHTIWHTGEKKYTCDICGKSFGYSNTLQYHKKSHLQDRQHECNVCHRFFLTSNGLKKHFRTHTGEKPYKCDVCNKQFTTSGNLSTHKKVHEKEKALCQVCDLTFAYKHILDRHMKIHNKDCNRYKDNTELHENDVIVIEDQN